MLVSHHAAPETCWPGDLGLSQVDCKCYEPELNSVDRDEIKYDEDEQASVVYVINKYNMVEPGHFSMARLSCTCSLVPRPSHRPVYDCLQQKLNGGKAWE